MIRVLHGDCRDVLKTLPAQSVQCVVTSPPYFGLRDYGTSSWNGGNDPGCDHVVGEIRTGLGLAKLGERYAGGGHKASKPKPLMAKSMCPRCGAVRVDKQIGLEPTPAAFVAEMVAVFSDVWRVLRDDGVCWLNLGDSYNSGTTAKRQPTHTGKHGYWENPAIELRVNDAGTKTKDLLGIPWRVAFALQDAGWYLRSEVIWSKPNPMPESVTDRPTKAHEQVFLLTKRPRYFYDAEAIKEAGAVPAGTRGAKGSAERFATPGVNSRPPEYKVYDGTRNARSVWTIATSPFPEAHFATFPPELAERCILAGTSERGCCPTCGAGWMRQIERVDTGRTQKMADGWDTGEGGHGTIHRGGREKGAPGIPVMTNATTGWQPTCTCPSADPIPCVVLDPFAGAGTSGLVADRLGRDAILIELNPDYIEIIQRRITKDAGLFAAIANA